MTKDCQDITCMNWQKLEEYAWEWNLRVLDQGMYNIRYDDTKSITLRTVSQSTETHLQNSTEQGECAASVSAKSLRKEMVNTK